MYPHMAMLIYDKYLEAESFTNSGKFNTMVIQVVGITLSLVASGFIINYYAKKQQVKDKEYMKQEKEFEDKLRKEVEEEYRLEKLAKQAAAKKLEKKKEEQVEAQSIEESDSEDDEYYDDEDNDDKDSEDKVKKE